MTTTLWRNLQNCAANVPISHTEPLKSGQSELRCVVSVKYMQDSKSQHEKKNVKCPIDNFLMLVLKALDIYIKDIIKINFICSSALLF